MLSENLCVGLVVLLAAAGCTQNFDDFRGNGGSGGAGVGGLGGGGGAPCDCDDDNICTQDLCDPDGGCLHPAAQVVTVPQVSGDCKNAICDGTMLAQEADARDVPIDDGNDCTTDECDGDMPVHPFVAPGATCNTDGVCDAMGQCSDCDDPGDCGTDTVCATYACTKNACVTTYLAPLVVSGEDDNDCKAMQCVDLEPEPQLLPFLMDTEVDTNPCTTDTCSAAGEIEHGPVGLGTACDNGLFCDGVDQCNAGTSCVSAGDPCTGGTVCADSCNEAADNCFDAAASPCNDNIFCNGVDTCNGTGTCQHPGDPCLPLNTGNNDCSESCNEGANNCTANDPVSTGCGDSNFCTVTDACNAGGSCAGTGNPCPGHNTGPSCDDSCNPVASNCSAGDALGIACDEDADLANGTCNGTTAAGNCVGD